MAGISQFGFPTDIRFGKALRLKVAFPNATLMEIPLAELPSTLTPTCAIPTTAGTGSEVGRSTVITMQQMGQKVVLGAPPLIAEMAILDPELNVGLSPKLTA